MKRKTTTIILVIIFLMGFSVLLYPVVSSYVNQMDATKATEQYDELMKKMENKKSESILNEANLYNENLTKDNVEYKNQEENKYADILNVDDSGSMGYISIPKIKVKIPIKHGTTDEVLSKYVGHLESSSLPVGGESTHAVLVAHRGLPNAKLFTDLDKMEIGDKFQITVLNKKLFYQVEEISVVKPEDISKKASKKFGISLLITSGNAPTIATTIHDNATIINEDRGNIFLLFGLGIFNNTPTTNDPNAVIKKANNVVSHDSL